TTSPDRRGRRRLLSLPSARWGLLARKDAREGDQPAFHGCGAMDDTPRAESRKKSFHREQSREEQAAAMRLELLPNGPVHLALDEAAHAREVKRIRAEAARDGADRSAGAIELDVLAPERREVLAVATID